MSSIRENRRLKIKKRVRRKVTGTSALPRLSVFRSNSAIYAQLIDDEKGVTLVSSCSKEVASDKKSANLEVSKAVGKKVAEKALEKGIKKVVFDRNGYLYHGKVKALAEGGREGGLLF
ncbi:MAG: 50S ribosomal protein L18 [Bacteroidetes bacterium]|nr:MAG: 50S ribosomal protein L18 [Bacteroidota bacterium]